MLKERWKRFEKSTWTRRQKVRLKRVVGREPRFREDVGQNKVFSGGWWYDPTLLDASSIVYSFGVGDTIDFDLELIERTRATVHAFDPTPVSLETLSAASLPPLFRFHQVAAAADDGVLRLYPGVRKDGSLSKTMYTLVEDERSRNAMIEVPAKTVASICEEMAHDTVDLVKLDIEGAEYTVIDQMLASGLRPRQLLVEFHHRHSGKGVEGTIELVDRIREAGYRIFALYDTGPEISFILDSEATAASLH